MLCPHPCNSAIGKTDEALFQFEEGVRRYASQRRRVLTRRACSSGWSLVRSIERRLALLAGDPSSMSQLTLPLFESSGDE